MEWNAVVTRLVTSGYKKEKAQNFPNPKMFTIKKMIGSGMA
jgi:hypothetical protein